MKNTMFNFDEDEDFDITSEIDDVDYTEDDLDELAMERLQVKRKYGEYTNIIVNENSKLRNRVIEFIGNTIINEEELKNFLNQIKEEKSGTFNTKKWYVNNSKFFEVKKVNNENTVKLSKLGLRIFEKISSNKKVTETIKKPGLFK